MEQRRWHSYPRWACAPCLENQRIPCDSKGSTDTHTKTTPAAKMLAAGARLTCRAGRRTLHPTQGVRASSPLVRERRPAPVRVPRSRPCELDGMFPPISRFRANAQCCVDGRLRSAWSRVWTDRCDKSTVASWHGKRNVFCGRHPLDPCLRNHPPHSALKSFTHPVPRTNALGPRPPRRGPWHIVAHVFPWMVTVVFTGGVWERLWVDAGGDEHVIHMMYVLK